MRRSAALCILVLWLAFLSGNAHAEEGQMAIEELVQKNENSYSCSFDGVKHSFLLDLPAAPESAPLVVMLPGYGNTAEAFRNEIHFETEANALGYAVVYVTGAPDPDSPTSAVGWNFETDTDGNRDVEFLVSLAGYLQKEYSLDRKHMYAVGFSNGAFMVHRLAMEAGGTFAAFVSVAGSMPESVWKERSASGCVSFFQITGEKDNVVPKNSDGSAQYARSPAIEDVMEYWVQANGLQLQETSRIGKASVLIKYGSAENQRQVWDLLVKDGRHSWPAERYSGIDTNSCILEFFEAQK